MASICPSRRSASRDPRGSSRGHSAALDRRPGRLTTAASSSSTTLTHTRRPSRRRGSSSVARSRPVPGWRRASATAGRPMAPDYETLLPDPSRGAGRARPLARADRARYRVSLDKDVPLDRQPLIADMASFLGEWQRRGADEIVVSWVKPADLPALLDAARGRAGLATSRLGWARHVQAIRSRHRSRHSVSIASQPHDVCLKCGRPTPLGVSLCENDNPGRIKSPSSTQVHGTIAHRRDRRASWLLLLLFRFGIGRHRPVSRGARGLLDARRRRPGCRGDGDQRRISGRPARAAGSRPAARPTSATTCSSPSRSSRARRRTFTQTVPPVPNARDR